MRFSALQKYILLNCYHRRGRFDRRRLADFYANKKSRPSDKMIVKVITKSIDRLIGRGYLAGFGEKTEHKWFIREIKLTAQGKKSARKLLGEQGKLPFKRVKNGITN